MNVRPRLPSGNPSVLPAGNLNKPAHSVTAATLQRGGRGPRGTGDAITGANETSPLMFDVVTSGNARTGKCRLLDETRQLGGAYMLSTMLQSLIGPRYPRRYIGRHRARLTIRFVSTRPARRNAVPSQRLGDQSDDRTAV